jgi:PAS domain S-box-containing protein
MSDRATPQRGTDGNTDSERVTQDATREAEDSRQSSRLLYLVNRVVEESLICKSVAEVAGVGLELAQELTQSPHGVVVEVDGQGRPTIIAQSSLPVTSNDGDEADSGSPKPSLQLTGAWKKLLSSTGPVLFDEGGSIRRFLVMPSTHTLSGSVLGVSLRQSDRVFGAMVVARRTGIFDASTIRNLDSFSTAFTLALVHRRALDALERREQDYRNLVDSLPDGITIAALDEKLILVNKAFADMLGYRLDELIGKTVLDLTDPKELDVVLAQTGQRRRGESSVYELKMLHKDGHTCIVRVSAIPARDESGSITGTITGCTDVTAYRQLEAQLQQQKRETELYASLLKHDVANDLQVVLGYLEAALMFYTDMGPATKQMVESALAGAERMARLVKAFGSLSTSTHFDIATVLKETAAEAVKVNRQLAINLVVPCEAEKLTVTGGALLPMTFENLLRNAAQHAGDSPVVNITLSRRGGFAEIVVSDNGPGVPEDIRKMLFTRGLSSSEHGVGLYIAKQVVVACGGSIELLDSDLGRGAAFRVLLPIAP